MSKPASSKARLVAVLFSLAVLLCLTAATLWWQHRSSMPADPAGEPAQAMLMALEDSRQPWLDNRQDLSTLLADLRSDAIASAALSDEAVFVSSRDGRHYWLADQSGRIGDMLMQQYAGREGALFPLLLVDTDGEAPWYEAAFKLWPFMLVGLLALGYLGLQLRPYRAQHKGTGIGFGDVIGAHEAKQALMDISACLRDPQRYSRLGARPPKGVLLTGAPGTGKTQLAKALATECGASFIQVTGSDFSSMYFGVGIQKVKALFRSARRKAPCIIFIDEIDGIGKRSEQTRSSDAESNRIINQFLTELDGFAGGQGVLLLGATNFPDSLDPALLREGRFDRRIDVGLPGLADREALFQLYSAKLRCASELDISSLARNSVGLSPAAIASIANQAALLAARAGASEVAMEHFVDALETNRIGEQPEGAAPASASDRTRVAVHEAGHALVAAALKVGRVEKVTILPRGQALGVTLVTPVEDKRLHLESELRARIRMLLAGRCAELLHFHETSSGAAQDLQEASRLALSMVGALGMGPGGSLLSLQAIRDAGIDCDPRDSLNAADALLRELDRECMNLLQRLRPALDDITAQLLEQETVSGDAVREAVAALLGPDGLSEACLREGRTHLERVAASSFEVDLAVAVQTEPRERDEGPGFA